jgi:hypothetical protein
MPFHGLLGSSCFRFMFVALMILIHSNPL